MRRSKKSAPSLKPLVLKTCLRKGTGSAPLIFVFICIQTKQLASARDCFYDGELMGRSFSAPASEVSSALVL